MLSQYFGFNEDPFGATPDSRYLYPSHTHREGLASLKYGFSSNRGFTAMIADPGMGKTTLLFRLLEDIRETSRSIFLFDVDPECEPRELVAFILRDMGISPGNSSSEMHTQFSDALANETRAGRRLVIVIDEAQNLSDAVLERVRLLTNFETSRGKLVHVVLSGQTQLCDKLAQPSLVQLRQRISTICRLDPLSTEDTAAYIDYRLKRAGYNSGPLFTDEALTMIAETSHGIPRTINNLCFNSLSLCRALNDKRVSGRMVGEVIDDLQLIPQRADRVSFDVGVAVERPHESGQPGQASRLLKLWVPATVLLLVLSVLCVLGFTELWPTQLTGASDRSMNLKPLPASVLPPSLADAGESRTTESAPNSSTFEITVEPGQRLRDISVKYLGTFDPRHLSRIRALNPKLTNPNHIESGQKIRLPGPLTAPMTGDTMTPTNEAKLR